MPKRIAAIWMIAVLLCTALASLLLAEGGVAPFGITGHDPLAHEVGVALNPDVQATFDDDVNAGTLSNDTFVVHGHLGGLASGSFSYHAGTRTVTLDPGRAFHAGEVLRVSATGGIASTGGAALAPYGWQFTAGPLRDRRFAGFTDTGAGLTGVEHSSVAWGDYDNDGDLDVLVTGCTGPHCAATFTEVYRNDGPSGFTGIGAGLIGVQHSSVAWGDYDNDGDLDILLTGHDRWFPRSRVYRNDGGSVFTDIGAGLTGVFWSSVAWGDYDNDGDLDILLTGNLEAKVYRNDTHSGFIDIGAGLAGVSLSSAAWGDYDNDGDLDILLTGCTDFDCYVPVSKLYRNDGASGFTDTGLGLSAVSAGSVAWGDCDNDGDLDILLTGEDSTDNLVSKVYRNDGGGVFTDIGADLVGVEGSSVAWGDYDNDGDLDILLTGGDSTDNLVSKVYRNDGGTASPAFTDIGAGLDGVSYGSVAWGDYDKDGDLDILLTGSTGSSVVSKVYRNNSSPELGTVTPSSGNGPVGATTYFTTTWSDPDGWENLKQCYFHVGADPSIVGNVTLMYNAAKNKLWLCSDDGATWLGGYAPGTPGAAVLNGQGILDCGQTTVQRAGDNLSVTWAIEFRTGFEGSKKLGLKCKDRDKAKAKGKWKGTWTVE